MMLVNPYVFAAGAGGGLPTLTNDAAIVSWSMADNGVYTDTGGATSATTGQTVAHWTNHGSVAQNALQSTSARRPTFRTGGLNGKPYLECVFATQQHFEDLTGIPQPSGSSPRYNPRSYAFVVDQVTVTNFPAILGQSNDTGAGKASLYFRTGTSEQIHCMNSGWRFGNLTNPTVVVVSFYEDGSDRIRVRVNDVAGQDTSVSSLTSAVTNVEFLRSSGQTGGSGGGFFDGRIYELIVWETKLDGADVTEQQDNMALVTDYLYAKYGLT